MQVLLFPSHFKYSPFCLFSLSVVTQIQGHIASCSPPLTGVRIYEIFILCYEGKAQIVQTNWKLRVRNRSQNGQQHEQWDRPPRRLAYTYLHDSAALSWRVLLYYAYICWRFPVHSVISPAGQYHKSLPRWPVRSIFMRGVLFIVSCQVSCSFCETC